MFHEVLVRFFIGGITLSAFAILGNLFRPKMFAGLFGAAPSVALATLTLAAAKNGPSYASTEARSMLAGTVALCFYSICVAFLLLRYRLPAVRATLSSTAGWFCVAFGLWFGPSEVDRMIVRFDSSTLRETHWHEYILRFVFGGVITAVAGLIARKFGPAVGGLFLAFPAIFPATATLIEKHQREKKQRKGLNGTRRGQDAAALDAVGRRWVALACWSSRF